MKKNYTSPQVVMIGDFRTETHGVWWGDCRDIFGGKAPLFCP